MELKSRPKMIRVTVYIEESAHRQFKSLLALEGVTVSEWVRQKIDKKLKK